MDKVICIGDSLTYGYGVNIRKCWVDILRKESGIEIINKGINGDTTSSMLFRSYEDIISLNPSKVIIMGGTNDFLKGYSLELVCNNIAELIKECICNSIIPIIASPLPVVSHMASNLWSSFIDYLEVNRKLSAYTDWIAKYSTNNNIDYLDFYSLFSMKLKTISMSDYYLDGIHPNEKGHELLSHTVMISGFLNSFSNS